MRIISGSCKGRRLYGPQSDGIRPALDKVKQAVFNILYDVSGANVLDLFAGTGSVGLEAISRGARQCVFVDAGKEALDLVRKNAALCRFENQSIILKRNIPDGIEDVFRKFGPFDLIFVDPPYDRDLVNPTLKTLSALEILATDGRIVVEHSPREIIQDIPGLSVVDQRKYGQTLITILKS